MLVMKPTYNNKIAPFAFDEVASKIVPANVNIKVSVIDVLSIKEKDLVYVLKFRMYMSWYDYRLKYHNLKESLSLNSLSLNEVVNLWIPFILFSNTEKSEFTEGDKESEMYISREGDFKESSLDIVDEINIFEGSENQILFKHLYSKEFRCLYQLQLYPFDTQVRSQMQKFHISSDFLNISLQRCTVDMELRDSDKTTVNLIPGNISMVGDTVLVQYIVESWSLEHRDKGIYL